MSLRGLIHTCTVQIRGQKQKLTIKTGTSAITAGMVLTGGTSHATATVETYTHTSGSWAGGDEAGYCILINITGTFQANEAVTGATTGAAVVNTIANYSGSDGKPAYYWANESTGVNCRFYSPNQDTTYIESGQVVKSPVKCMVGASVILTAVTRRLTTTDTGFSGTWTITGVVPRTNAVGIDHYEATLEAA